MGNTDHSCVVHSPALATSVRTSFLGRRTGSQVSRAIGLLDRRVAELAGQMSSIPGWLGLSRVAVLQAGELGR